MYGKVTSMATERRQEPEWRLERQRASLCQERRAQFETAPTRGRQQARLLLRADGGHEEEAHKHEDRKRSRFED